RLFKGFSGYGLTIPFNGHFERSEKSRYLGEISPRCARRDEEAACFTVEIEMELPPDFASCIQATGGASNARCFLHPPLLLRLFPRSSGRFRWVAYKKRSGFLRCFRPSYLETRALFDERWNGGNDQGFPCIV
ncbi:hypothetical protein, partial [Desulfobulbus sp.]|uniref:hypothetical protein n=1 Tax=Desulfobulbus sp. TaxID=895 RepID=UPI0027BAD012